MKMSAGTGIHGGRKSGFSKTRGWRGAGHFRPLSAGLGPAANPRARIPAKTRRVVGPPLARRPTHGGVHDPVCLSWTWTAGTSSRPRSCSSAGPSGLGPSSNTWPRWPPQRAQCTSVRAIMRAGVARRCRPPPSSGWKKLGQPVPDSNFVEDRNSALLATGASEGALTLLAVERAGPRKFGPMAAQDPELRRGQPPLPFRVWVGDLESLQVLGLGRLAEDPGQPQARQGDADYP